MVSNPTWYTTSYTYIGWRANTSHARWPKSHHHHQPPPPQPHPLLEYPPPWPRSRPGSVFYPPYSQHHTHVLGPQRVSRQPSRKRSSRCPSMSGIDCRLLEGMGALGSSSGRGRRNLGTPQSWYPDCRAGRLRDARVVRERVLVTRTRSTCPAAKIGQIWVDEQVAKRALRVTTGAKG